MSHRLLAGFALMPDPREFPPTKTQSDHPDALASEVGGDTQSEVRRDEDAPPFRPTEHAGEVGRLGRYRVQKKLGQGGMGAVYLALDEGLERRVALKVMLPKFAAVPAARERFEREASTCATVASEHVVTIYDVSEDAGVPFIAMEYLKGYPLDDFLKKHHDRLSVPQVLRVGREVALGLAAAHAAGLVHRDIKPSNLWLEYPKGRIKILDFGLAKPVAPDGTEDSGKLTNTGAVVGTPAYMSPEQARGIPVDHRTDLFSLGGVLFRLATGRLPFHGPTAIAILTSLGMDTPPSVRELNPDVPPELDALIHRLLAKKPADRPASAGEVAAELKQMERALAAGEMSVGDPVVMSPAGSGGMPVIDAPIPVGEGPNAFEGLDEPSEAFSEMSAAPEAGAAGAPKRGGGWRVWALAAVALAVLGALGVGVWQKFGAPKAQKQPDDTANVTPPPAPTPAPKVAPPDSTDPTFFNGKDLTGWGGGGKVWRVENGELVGAHGPGSGWDRLHLMRRVRDFELTFEARSANPISQSTLDFRSSSPSGVSLRVAEMPGQLFRYDEGGPRHTLLSNRPKRVEPNKYFAFRVRVVDKRLTVAVDGVVVSDGEYANLPDGEGLRWTLAPNCTELRVRNIRFTDLTPKPIPGEWRPLFDGKSLAGWAEVPGWSAADGAIVCTGREHNKLIADPEFTDFELELEFTATGNSGVFFRAPHPSWPVIKLTPLADDPRNACGSFHVYQNGGIVTTAPLASPKLAKDEWSKVSLRVEGKNVRAAIFGVVCQASDLKIPTSGKIALQQVLGGGTVKFRNVRVRDLKPPTALAPTFFNGTLDGWKASGPGDGKWSAEGGEIVCRAPADSTGYNLLAWDGSARDFLLTFEATATPNPAGNKTAFLRFRRESGKAVVLDLFPEPGRLRDDTAGPWKAFPGVPAPPAAARAPAGTAGYSTFTVLVVGRRLTATANNVVVAENYEMPATLSPAGSIAWQADNGIGELRLRNVRFVELPAPDPTFFSGKTLAGWQGDAKVWKAENGELVGTRPAGDANGHWLTSDRAYRDFFLTFRAKLAAVPGQNYIAGGLRCRWESEQRYIEVGLSPASTGQLWNAYPLRNPSPASQAGLKAGDYNDVAILAVGDRFTVFVNGVPAADAPVQAVAPAAGKFRLQLGASCRELRVRDLVFRDLSRQTLPTAADVLTSPDWEWAAKPENLGDAVNTAGDEWDPAVTPDGLLLVCTAIRNGVHSIREVRRKSVDEPFADARELKELAPTGADKFGQPFLSPDGQTIWYSVVAGGTRREIWTAKRADRDAPFGKPERLPDAVNKEDARFPAVSPDGQTLYFAVWHSSARRHELWASRRDAATGAWDKAEPLGPEINTEGDEARPWPLADGSGFTFVRTKPGEAAALIVATPKPGGGWDGRPSLINAGSGTCTPADGQTAYYSSHLPKGGKGGADLWQLRRVPKGKPVGATDPERKADRAAAEWVLSKKGEVRIDGSDMWRKSGDALPAGPFKLTHVRFNEPAPGATDADLARFAQCPDVVFFQFWHSTISDRGLETLAGAPGGRQRVTLLIVESDRKVTDAGLKTLTAFPGLRTLGLKRSAVTDDGLPHLYDLTALTSVNLFDTKVTAEGIKKLAAARPDLEIVWNGGTIGPTKK